MAPKKDETGFFKRAHAGDFARLDTTLYAPLCLALAVGVFFAGVRNAAKL